MLRRSIIIYSFVGVLALGGHAEEALRPGAGVIDALRQHYVDRETLDVQKLNAASEAGILRMVGPGAKLLSAEEAAATTNLVVKPGSLEQKPLARVEVIQPDIGYIRLEDVTAETAVALDEEIRKFAAAKVSGYVLDLRFADGTNHAAAATVASRFLPTGQDVFTWKSSAGAPQMYRTADAPKSLATELAATPLMLLVNAQTRGSAEVLAGALRSADRGILIGAPTAGLPAAWQDVRLADGRVLRVATAKITFPNGGELFPGGLIPDILVKIDPTTERDVVFELQKNMTLTASLQPQTKPKSYSEAELVRAFKGERLETPSLQLSTGNGTNSGELALGNAPAGEPANGAVRDVVLQRAVDILKGIRVLLSWQ